jgi:hypothetical protein
MDYGGSRRSIGIVASSIRSIGGARLRRRRKSTGRIVITVVIGNNTWELNLSDTSSIMRIMRRRGEKRKRSKSSSLSLLCYSYYW